MNWFFWRKKPMAKLIVLSDLQSTEVTDSIQLALQGVERRTIARLEDLQQRVRSVKEQAMAAPARRKG